MGRQREREQNVKYCQIKKDGKTNRMKKTEKLKGNCCTLPRKKQKSKIDFVLIQFKGGKLCDRNFSTFSALFFKRQFIHFQH
jgi:hypothetical protein